MTPTRDIDPDAVLAVLGLAHARGAQRSGGLGGRWPGRPAGDRLDLVVVAPRLGEAASRRRRRALAAAAGGALAPGGIVVILGAPPARWLLRRELVRAGLAARSPLVLLPRPGAPRFAATPASAGAGGSARRRGLALLLRVPGMAAALPQAADVLGDAGSEPSFAWLLASATPGSGARVTVTVSWRGTAGGAIVAGGIGPAVVAKVAFADADRLRRENAALSRLAAAARSAGAHVPEPHGVLGVGSATALLVRPVPGRPVAAALAAGRLAPLDVLAPLADWLRTWHRDTATELPLTTEDLDAWLLAPARELALGDRYEAWLGALAARVAGRTAPLVAAHNDLTAANVLWDGDRLSIVDWEMAHDRALPLTDFLYAAVDVAQAAPGVTRVAAFHACFGADGHLRAAVDALRDGLARDLALAPDVATAAFHACFLHHAANERRAGGGPERPFLALVVEASRLALEAPSS